MYEYRATVQKVIDGDTIKVLLDQGLYEFRVLSIRFFGINAPELRTPEGPPARAHLITLLSRVDGTFAPLVIRTIKDEPDKYGGRWDGKVWRESDGSWGDDNQFVPATPSVNELMISDGFAVAYNP